MTRVGLFISALGLVGFVAVACGGSSSDDDGHQGGSAGSAGAQPSNGGAGGASGGATASGGAPGCYFNGTHHPSGTDWPFGCNTCSCESGRVSCTLVACAGAGGAEESGGSPPVAQGGAGAASGGTSGGQTGSGGEPNQCVIPNGGGTLCVVAADGGNELRAGMALKLTLRVAGCFSTSCTHLAASGCSYLGMDGNYAISNYTCLSHEPGENGRCTEDCDGAPTVPCAPGITLQEGDYALTLAPYPQPVLRFHVPSQLPGGSLCIDTTQP